MRIIKLSTKDNDFPDRASVDRYFALNLPNRTPPGQFLFTARRIADGGIQHGELIIFSYEGNITHIAKAASGRCKNLGDDCNTYPYYFVVDLATLLPATGTLSDVEVRLRSLGLRKNIVRTRGWPRIPDAPEIEQIWKGLSKTH